MERRSVYFGIAIVGAALAGDCTGRFRAYDCIEESRLERLTADASSGEIVCTNSDACFEEVDRRVKEIEGRAVECTHAGSIGDLLSMTRKLIYEIYGINVGLHVRDS